VKIFSWKRTLPDGRTAAGPLVYILLSLGILALFVYYNYRASEVAKPQTRNTAEAQVDERAANVTEGDTSRPRPRFNLPVGPTGENVSMLDQFERARQLDPEVTDENDTRDNEPDLILVTPTPGPTPIIAQPVPTVMQIDPAQLVVEGVQPTPTPVTDNRPPNPSPPRPRPSGFETKNFLPRGAVIPVYILSMVKTGDMEDMVEMGVAKNVVFNGKVQLPFGTRILGSAAMAGDGDRVAINVDTILFPNGDELPISATVKDMDRGPGVRGYYIPQPLWVQLLPYVNNFLAAYLNTLQKTITTDVTYVTPNGMTITQQQQVADMSDSQTQLLSSASESLQQATIVTMQELNKLYKPYLVVPPGTPAFVQLRQATDLTRRRVNGSIYSPMPPVQGGPTLPGFENNPIGPAGLDFSAVNSDNPMAMQGGPQLPMNTTMPPQIDGATPIVLPQPVQPIQQNPPVLRLDSKAPAPTP
jgi:hypothetical protein